MHLLVAVGACVGTSVCALSLHAFLCLGESERRKTKAEGAGHLRLVASGIHSSLCISLFVQPHLWICLPGILPHLVLKK